MKDIYIGGFDYARGGSDLSNASKGDDFSLMTARIRGNETHFCHAFRYTGIQAGPASAIIHDHNLKFEYTMLIGDPGGGGLFVRDELRKPIQDDGRRRFPVRPIITLDDTQLMGVGNPILVLFKRGDPVIESDPPYGLGMKFPSDAGLINKAHEIMKTDLEKRLLMLPKPWQGWGRSGQSFASPDAMRKWLNRQALSPMDKVRAEMDLTLLQLITVDRKTDKDGSPVLDKDQMYQFVSKRKKDSAYALVYMYFGVWLYRSLQALKKEDEPDNRDFICHSEEIRIPMGPSSSRL